jgi:hypothetical protein
MRPTHALRRPLRTQRGTVARGVLVLAVLAGAVLLQQTTPVWQSRLDAAAAFIGVPYAQCDKASQRSAAPSSGWHAGKPSMVAGATAGNPSAAGFIAPAI